MRRSTVIAESDVPRRASEGDMVLERAIFDASDGSEVLVQRVPAFARGTSRPRGYDAPALRPGSCFHLRPGIVHCFENTGPGVMRILGVFRPSGDPVSRTYDQAALTAEGGNK